MITIINGDSGTAESTFSTQARQLAKSMGQRHKVHYYELQRLKIHQCIGCWSCWWKTPGVCAFKDDAEPIFRSVIQSDLVVFASPIQAGFTSGLLKKLQDRLIVLIHPYIEMIEGECHHRKRYDSYPDLALFLQKEKDTDAEDLEIIKGIYQRIALNFHGKLRHVWVMENHSNNFNEEEICHDLSFV